MKITTLYKCQLCGAIFEGPDDDKDRALATLEKVAPNPHPNTVLLGVRMAHPYGLTNTHSCDEYTIGAAVFVGVRQVTG